MFQTHQQKRACDDVNTVHDCSFDRVGVFSRSFVNIIVKMFRDPRTPRTIQTDSMNLNKNLMGTRFQINQKKTITSSKKVSAP
jgi:hypothetical protein